MAGRTHIFLVLFIFVQISYGLDICGLEDVKKCNLSDQFCLVNLEYGLRQWFQRPEAEGFFCQSLDPLVLDQISFEVQHQRIKLKGVKIYGLANSVYDFSVDFETDKLMKISDTYIHELSLDANYSTVVDLKTGNETIDKNMVCIEFSNMKTCSNVDIVQLSRCTGTNHTDWRLQKVRVKGGSSHIRAGLKTALGRVDLNEFSVAIVDEVAEVVTRNIYNNHRSFFSIIDYNKIYI